MRKALVAGLMLVSTGAFGQTWPTKTIRYMVPFPPAGATDILARIVADKLGPALGQTVIIENRAGAAGNIGSELAARSAPDGHTILMATAAQSINETLYTKMPFSLLRDFTTVAMVAHVPNIMEVHPSLPVRTVKEFIEVAKARPGQINYASTGYGTSIHMSAELFMLMTGVKLTHITYKGSAPALTDLMAGQTQVMFDNLPASMQYIKAGKLRPLAVTTSQRFAGLPDIPTVAEAGVPGYEATGWFGILAPAAVPREVVTRLNAEVNRVLGLADVRERFAQQGALPAPRTPEEFAKSLREDVAKWAKVVKASGAKVE